MSENVKNETKWLLYLRGDQCAFISDVMAYIVAHADERISDDKFPFDQMSATSTKERAQEIASHIADATT